MNNKSVNFTDDQSHSFFLIIKNVDSRCGVALLPESELSVQVYILVREGFKNFLSKLVDWSINFYSTHPLVA